APEQFAYSLLTRSQRISHENLRVRDAGWLEGYERWLAQQARKQVSGVGGQGADGARAVSTQDAQPAAGQDAHPMPPMLTPYRAGEVVLKNRIVVSPMAMYSCVDGIPSDFHLVHLGARAMGGAGLVMVEMTCVSPEARITPGCPGLWNDTQ